MNDALKTSEAEYCNEDEAARITGLSPEKFRERLKWVRGHHPVERNRERRSICVRTMVKPVQDALAAGHVVRVPAHPQAKHARRRHSLEPGGIASPCKKPTCDLGFLLARPSPRRVWRADRTSPPLPRSSCISQIGTDLPTGQCANPFTDLGSCSCFGSAVHARLSAEGQSEGPHRAECDRPPLDGAASRA